MEKLLHFIWKNRLILSTELETTSGESLEIIDPGIHNTDAGPDFFNAKIKIGNTLWVGNVEVHTYSSDWMKHNHQDNNAYDSVILHVVKHCDSDIYRNNGEAIPQYIIKYPESINVNYQYLLHADSSVFCLNHIPEIPPVFISSWLAVLQSERLEQKMIHIENLLDQCKNDWEEVLYIILVRYFGSGINSDAFERLARSIPLTVMLKQADSIFRLEALFFGQSGLLSEEDVIDEYYIQLRKEYLFLKQKYGLKFIEKELFKSFRIRPNGFPEMRIAQLAAVYHKHAQLFSAVLNTDKIEDLMELLSSHPSSHWETHYNFKKKTIPKKKTLGSKMIQTLIINAIIPVLFTYGKSKGNSVISEKALHFLESLPCEENKIISEWKSIGIDAQNAAESQALLQLKQQYCDAKKCLFCRIGRFILCK